MFLSPLLLGGLVLASAPIIIHLLNRRRFIRVDWAPMRVLKQTMKSNRKRVRLEQWLLLALRTLAVAALILAIARPISSGAHLASLFELSGRASRIVVIDDSLSMGTRVDGRTSFDRAAEAAGALLSEIGADDEVTVVTTSHIETPLVQSARLETPDAVLGQLQDAGTTDVGNVWGQTFAGVDTLLRQATYPVREVTIVSDLGRNGWGEDVTRIATRWAAEEVTFRVLDVGRELPGGLQLTSLKPRDPVVLIDTDTSLLAMIENTSGDLSTGETMTVRVDGIERTVDLPDIAAGSAVTVPIDVTFADAGSHRVDVELLGDSLPADGRGFAVVDVRANLDVVLIDGEPGIEPFEGETDFLALALSAGYSRVRVTTLLASDWDATPIATADLVVLANVDQLPDARIRELEKLVEAGTGLIVFAGTAVSPELYNAQLYLGGAGLLPAKLGEPVEVEQQGLVLGDVSGSPIEPLAKLNPAALSDVNPQFVIPASIDPAGDSRILASWNDAESSPALISHRYGDGTVMLVTVSADRDWSDWPTKPTYVFAMRSAAFSMAGRIGDDRNLIAGEPLTIELDAARLPERVGISRGSTSSVDAVIRKESNSADGAGSSPSATYTTTQSAGFYTANWAEPSGTEFSRVFAVSPAVDDSTRERIDEQDLTRILGPLDADIISWAGSVDATAGAAELWRYAVIAMIVLLIAESLLGSWIDRGRRQSAFGNSNTATPPRKQVAA